MNSSMSKQKKTTIIVIAIVVVLVIAALVCWAAFRPKALEGTKTITVNVAHTDAEARTEQFKTKAEYLAGALEEGGIEFDGDETEYGLFITTMDGEFADSTAGTYWMFDVNGSMGEYGVDSQPVADGDVYDFYTITY